VPAFLSLATPIPFYVPLLLGAFGRLSPKKAARFLANFIARPRGRNPTQPWELATGTAGREVELRTGLHARSWGEKGPLVLALHGWRGRTTQFRPLAAKLLEKGMRTLAIDLPGHGASVGDSATPRELGELLVEVERILGPAHAAIGHSFGGAALGAGLVYGFRPKRIVIVSSPTRVSRIPFIWAKTLHLPRRSMAYFAQLLDGHAGRPVAELDLVATAPHCGIPALLVHDRGDAVIPHGEAGIQAAAWPELKTISTDGLGHRDILANAAVVQAVTGFIAGDAS